MDDIQLSDLFSEEELEQFRTEIQESLAGLEESLLHLEQSPTDMERIGSVFRVMHTIKGTAGMYGFEEAAAFTHRIENCFDRLRNRKLTLTREIIDLTLAARDQLGILFSEDAGSADVGEIERISTAFKDLSDTVPSQAPAAEPTDATPEAGTTLFRIRFRFDPADPVLKRATNPLIYLQSLTDLKTGPCLITCHTDAVPALEQLEPGVCYFYWDVQLETAVNEDGVRGEFIFIEDDLSELTVERIAFDQEPSEETKKIGEILVDRGDLTQAELEKTLEERQPTGKLLEASGQVSPQQVQSALNEQKLIRERNKKQAKQETIANVRISSDKLDDLVNQVGELVIVQARLRQIVLSHHENMDANSENSELATLVDDLSIVAEDVTRLTERLRDSAMEMRLLPIGSLFSRFTRLVRDLARDLGKEINLVTEGGETELDKTVIEHLNDPLVHLIRNSVDHGIESLEERRAVGKPAQGTVTLSAIHAGANVLIRIQDDGKGLDLDRIRAKAITKGLISEETVLTEQETFNLIFAAGFSTVEKVTNVSGRGVGMDVVKKSINALRGSIEIQSLFGKGTTLSIKLPLTLAIIDGFLVQSAGEQFVLPLTTVRECVKLTSKDQEQFHGRRIINLRNETVPYIRLRDIFGLSGQESQQEHVVITELDRKRIGMVVDQVIGQSQVVIKSLGVVFENVAEFSGATILGNGKVVPILDVARIIESAKSMETSA